MNRFEKTNYRCFLCRQKNLIQALCIPIEGTYCKKSKKSVKAALVYLAKCNKTELEISKNEVICVKCYEEILDFDRATMKALYKQQKLIQKIESASLELYSEDEMDCIEHMATMEEINNPEFFNDVMIDGEEMDCAINGGRNSQKKKSEKQHNPIEETTSTTTTNSKQKSHYFEHVLECPLCAMHFRSKTRLQKHILSAHKKFKCELCEYSHRNEDYVKLHMNTHEGRREECCLYCQKEFSSKISTIRHMEVHIDEKKYQCDKCGLCFSQTTVLYNHKLQHEAEEKPLQCDICKQMFKTKRTYRHHMITHRPDRPRFTCEYCKKQFTEKYTLKVHLRTHPEVSMADVDADADANEQQQHLLLQVTPEVSNTVQVQSTTYIDDDEEQSKYKCIICDVIFASKEQLNKHMEKEHDVIMSSLSVNNYSNYEVVKVGGKKSCSICGQMFGTQLNLEYHLKKVHFMGS